MKYGTNENSAVIFDCKATIRLSNVMKKNPEFDINEYIDKKELLLDDKISEVHPIVPIDTALIRDKVREAIFLLGGFQIIQVMTPVILPMILPLDALMLWQPYAKWIITSLFGFLILMLSWNNGAAAIPVGILTAFTPVFGVIFYVLISLQNINRE